MLWPKGETELKTRVIVAVLLVLAGKAVTLLGPYALKLAVDRMSGTCGLRRRRRAGRSPTPARASAGCCPTICATRSSRRSARMRRGGSPAKVFRHVHDLSLRFHLERRTGSLTKIVERGTKSIDMMLYFLLFNIAPTVIELTAICVIFFVKFGAGLVAATLAIVVIYIAFTRQGERLAHAHPAADERRRQQGDRPRGRFACSTTRPSNISAPRIARPSATRKRSAPSPAPRCATRSASPGSTSASR